jgi:hypothetical protein
VGGFGISAKDDPFLLEDVQLVRQTCTSVSVVFEDEAVADFFDRQVDAGLRPERFARVWVHTHPGSSAEPSMMDEDTFLRVFGTTDWAVMFILAKGGQTYARLRFNVGPGGELLVPVSVDYSHSFGPSDHSAWQEEYLSQVQVAALASITEHVPDRPWWLEEELGPGADQRVLGGWGPGELTEDDYPF